MIEKIEKIFLPYISYCMFPYSKTCLWGSIKYCILKFFRICKCYTTITIMVILLGITFSSLDMFSGDKTGIL